jgi:hypothetical protein
LLIIAGLVKPSRHLLLNHCWHPAASRLVLRCHRLAQMG